jgi:hypothetical protein
MSPAHDITMNMSNSQTIAALSHVLTEGNVRVNIYNADNVDKISGDGAFGRRVGIFASDALNFNSSINILGANSGHTVIISDDKSTATLSLDAGQGTSNAVYVRAFALGNDFTISIARRTAPNTCAFCPVTRNGKINMVNIIGAISKGKGSTGTTDSSLTVDWGWMVNIFDPIDDLEAITMRGNNALNLSKAASSISKIEIERG